MDIQGYILDRWMAKMKAESPVLTIYDKDGLYIGRRKGYQSH